MGLSFTIRSAEMKDTPHLAEILAGVEWLPSASQDPAELAGQTQRHLEMCLASAEHTVLAGVDEDDLAVGYCSVHWLPYLILERPEGFISELFVHRDWRGCGVGGRLLRSARALAIERGCGRLMLFSGRNREVYDRGFYQREGWQERSQVANFILSL